MPLDLALDLAHALDPVAFVQDRLKFEPDPWQARLLRSGAPWILLNCCRQSGKSTTTAAVDTGDHKAAAALSGRLHENLALVAKLTGSLCLMRAPALPMFFCRPISSGCARS